MYLSLIEICNFRSFEKLRVELQPGLNVLVGRNNTGKTNLLQAIRHALGPSSSRGETLWLDSDDFYKESTDDEDRTISIILTFSGLTEEQRAYFYEIVDFDLSDLDQSKAIIRFTASRPKNKKKYSIKRSGGPINAEMVEVPSSLLESLPITFLPALRDAEAWLAPGYRNRLAQLLVDLVKRNENKNNSENESTYKDEIESIFKAANKDLVKHPLIKGTVESLQGTTKDIAGSDYEASTIRAAEVQFEKILRTLQVQMDGGPINSLSANGLGFNNLLFMAVVLEHLKGSDQDENPLLLIEEPEAHLHPQLTKLLSEYLAKEKPESEHPQTTIVTTHSPTMASSVPPNRIHVLFANKEGKETSCNSISEAQMDNKEQQQLQRMMDITRATLYFAKAAILVEGISEALIVPVFAKRLGYHLTKMHVSVIPICGVAFGTFEKLLNPEVLGIPVSIITDADPPILNCGNWETAMPECENGQQKLSDRTKKLKRMFENHKTVKVFNSKITLEYDLAEAGAGNAMVMAEVWESCFPGKPSTFNCKRVNDAGDDIKEKALAAWRGICLANTGGSKAEFAHNLATSLDEQDEQWNFVKTFEVPEYLKEAIKHVVDRVEQPIPIGTGIAE